MFKNFIGALVLSLTLSYPAVSQEVELIDAPVTTQQKQEQTAILIIEKPTIVAAELLTDLLVAGKYELALDLALGYFPFNDEPNDFYIKKISKPLYKIVRGIAYHYLGEVDKSQAEFNQTREILNTDASDKELADAVINVNRTVGTETSHTLGIWFHERYDEDFILEFVNDYLHSLNYRAINQAASFAIQVRRYADNPEFYLKRGIARYHLGERADAAKDFQKAKVLYQHFGSMKQRRQADWIIDKLAVNSQNVSP